MSEQKRGISEGIDTEPRIGFGAGGVASGKQGEGGSKGGWLGGGEDSPDMATSN
ncbi:hypothetical protein CRG98_025508 [Punica granatum]|uniref:Uncharacterized protein n=1 Tax=Punica granatum TaxID=22663 RepID=A0A2I0JCX7_PUNGR|nr:hypothetical protein CRG98_025508 [Punica granatum]